MDCVIYVMKTKVTAWLICALFTHLQKTGVLMTWLSYHATILNTMGISVFIYSLLKSW